MVELNALVEMKYIVGCDVELDPKKNKKASAPAPLYPC
jgi:hypothetical protein